MNCTACGSAVAPGVTTCPACGAAIVPARIGDYVRVDTGTERLPTNAQRIRPLVPPPPPTGAGVAGGPAPVVVQPAAPRPPMAGLISVPPGIHAPVVQAAPEPIEPPVTLLPGATPPAPTVVDPTAIDDETRVAPRRTGGTWQLVLPTGERLPLSSSVIVGREPTATLVAGAASLAVQDSDKSVSKSHAVFELSETGLTVRDLGSTNGVIVVGPDGEDTEVYGNIAVPLRPGSSVELGRFVIHIEIDPA